MKLRELLGKTDESTAINIAWHDGGRVDGCSEDLLDALKTQMLNMDVDGIMVIDNALWINVETAKTTPARITRKFDFDGGDQT